MAAGDAVVRKITIRAWRRPLEQSSAERAVCGTKVTASSTAAAEHAVDFVPHQVAAAPRGVQESVQRKTRATLV